MAGTRYLGGWTRLGIIASVLWAIGAWFYVNKVALKAASDYSGLMYKVCTDAA